MLPKNVLGMLLVSLLTTSCSTPPKPDLCSIVNVDTAECNPHDPREKIYDLKISEMLGYVCISPQDFGDIKAYIKNIMDELD